MIDIGEVVFVGTKGICKIEDIKKNAFVGCDKSKEYYVLKPLSSSTNMVVFLPTDTKIKIRKLTSKSIAKKILNEIGKLELEGQVNEEERQKALTEILKEVDLEKRARFLNYMLNRKMTISKKLFSAGEQKVLNTLLDCVVDEISCVLSEDKESVRSLILSKFEK